ncbi:hypothetical protein GCM10022403_034840 [Streptomyces coacervatus]|uniref:Tetratricopeptide repeat protein n=1 Tax=Streptomyces coacervatus TaxID=647381 RepID=A0ABP7HTV9_9ACTN|nr:tetratricopeptide repeat protein [Streptomyces coacervatus]MDF2272042.1 tetratricopeptide repeat protein [Streptomyces coacervatus]
MNAITPCPPSPNPPVVLPLPSGIPELVGRTEELQRLIAVTQAQNGCLVQLVTGMPGVGKKELALRAARMLSVGYGESQNCRYLDLRGDDKETAVSVCDALEALLLDRGTDPWHIPPDESHRQQRWQRETEKQGILLVLDNASGVEQVTPLLPSSRNCLVIVTSRFRLKGLSVKEGPVRLHPLTSDEALDMFRMLSTPPGTRPREFSAADESTVRELVRYCGHLPRYIAVLARTLTDHPTWTVRDLKTRYRSTVTKDGEFAEGAAFHVAYEGLSSDGARSFFRHLALNVGADIDVYASAALEGISYEKATEHIDLLYEGHLVEEHKARYRLNPLVREAMEAQLKREDGEAECRMRTARLLDYYQYTAEQADRLFSPHVRHRLSVPLPVPAAVPDLVTAADAQDWLREERSNLFFCAEHAARTPGEELRVMHLSESLAGFLDRRGPWQQGIRLHAQAETAAALPGHELEQAKALIRGALLRTRLSPSMSEYGLAFDHLEKAIGLCRIAEQRAGANTEPVWRAQAAAYFLQGRVSLRRDDKQTEKLLRQALQIYQDLGDPLGAAGPQRELSVLLRATDIQTAKQLAQEARDTYRTEGYRLGEAQALVAQGLIALFRGDVKDSADLFEESLEIYSCEEEHVGEANTLINLAAAQRRLGHYEQAGETAQKARGVFEGIGVPQGVANAKLAVGEVFRVTGKLREAATICQGAVDSYRGLGDTLGQAGALDSLGVVLRLVGEYDKAAETLEKARALHEGRSRPFGEAETQCHLGVVKRLMGDYDEAEELLTAAHGLFETTGYRHGEANALQQLGAVRRLKAAETGDTEGFQESGQLLAKALSIFCEIENPLGQANAISGLGLLDGHLGHHKSGETQLRDALGRYQALKDDLGEAEALNNLAWLKENSGSPFDALPMYEQAGLKARAVDSPLETGRALLGAGRCKRVLGRRTAYGDLSQAWNILDGIRAAQRHEAAEELALLWNESNRTRRLWNWLRWRWR